MRTTVRLDPALMAKVKEESAHTGETLTAMIERGLRLVLARSRRSRPRTIIRVPVSRATGGLRPGVNLDDSAALLDIMEKRE
jgi:hypothetical protein